MQMNGRKHPPYSGKPAHTIASQIVGHLNAEDSAWAQLTFGPRDQTMWFPYVFKHVPHMDDVVLLPGRRKLFKRAIKYGSPGSLARDCGGRRIQFNAAGIPPEF